MIMRILGFCVLALQFTNSALTAKTGPMALVHDQKSLKKVEPEWIRIYDFAFELASWKDIKNDLSDVEAKDIASKMRGKRYHVRAFYRTDDLLEISVMVRCLESSHLLAGGCGSADHTSVLTGSDPMRTHGEVYWDCAYRKGVKNRKLGGGAYAQAICEIPEPVATTLPSAGKKD